MTAQERQLKWVQQNRQRYLELSRRHTDKYRKQNPEKFAAATEASRKKRGRRNRRFVDAYKAFFGCAKCPECDPVVLDLHHRNPEEKEFTISKWLWRASLKALANELEKCEVLCANCHRRIHRGESR